MTDDRHGGDFLASGTRLEEFEIERALGRGGFGVTYLAYDHSLDCQVAIKEYLPRDWGTRGPDGDVGPLSATHVKDYEWGLERFLKEARALRRLRHAHIVQVHRVLDVRGTAYMVMEYVKGRSLAAALDSEGPWPEKRVRALLELLLPGVEKVHEADLVHRDIKPANVMLREDDSPVLIDFGAVRQAAGGRSGSLQPVLTPGYAPIEQYSEKGVLGPWTDVYALGAVAYEALSGRVPDEATERASEDILRPVAEVAPQAVSDRLSSAVMSALAFRQEDRPQSVEEWRALLPLVDSEPPEPEPPVDGEPREPEPPETRPWLTRLAELVTVTSAVISLVWWLGGFGDEPVSETVGTVAPVPVGENPSPAENETGSSPENPTSEDLARDGTSHSRLVFRDCVGCPEMVVIPAGMFEMGSPGSDGGRRHDEGPQHHVTLKSFALGMTEVTFDEWDACVRGGGCNGYSPRSGGWGRGSRPVIFVSWKDAQAYVSWLSATTGAEYRLPSESEWEYAARAETTTIFHTGATISMGQANYTGLLGTGREWTTPVGSFAPNAFGLYDVHGNVWEWVEDCVHDSYQGAPSDGTAWTVGGDCGHRVLRGGSWDLNPPHIRSAKRGRSPADSRNYNAGFRVAKTLD